uniref:Tetraacyldisaccharide-1-P 4-kinase n=1 Tax=Siphoviridae sp. ctLqe90 TaxID=2825456 RepID=A0A8S5Q3Y9_9CAUD|nr:MAG TPA: Tetraacyldisaccharide-1-P 4-kinase [Siphoviridae sp. ctLqe90]
MANKPVLGIIDCPHCGRANMVGWDGNYKVLCFYCHKTYTAKRTRMRDTKPLILPDEEMKFAR